MPRPLSHPLLTPARGLLITASPAALPADLGHRISAVAVPPDALATFRADGARPGVRMETELPIDGLSRRLETDAEHGATFAYWRVTLDAGRYSGPAARAGTHALARCAVAGQAAGLIAVLDLR